MREVAACRPWLEAEIEAVHPKIVVCMGATAAQSVVGRPVPIMKQRGKFIESKTGPAIFITIHPSSILRQQEDADREREYRAFASEMKLVRRKLDSMKG